MKRMLAIHIFLFFVYNVFAQNPWKITATKIDPSNYYGITVANGQIGIVSSAEAFKVKDVVLAGAYDLYGRGRVSNFLKSFNLLNIYMEIDGRRLSNADATNMKQELDMQHASFTTSFDYKDIATVSYTYYALRHLPYSVLMDIPLEQKRILLLAVPV
jgi:protein-glucosylgalactosylhydroxylysine glucosidase